MLVVAEREQLPVREAKAGEPEAWSVLLRRYQLPLYVYVFEMARDEQTSLDIVQETFIAAVRHERVRGRCSAYHVLGTMRLELGRRKNVTGSRK
jgi:DNA-directed RNA polymerase specialized sigma24 family protein